MGYSIKNTTNQQDFSGALKNKKFPLLVLDQKWHHLFAGGKKPDYILKPEKKLNELLAKQGRLQQELKELKKIKFDLMNGIMEHMEGAEGNHQSSKKLEENRKLITEINNKIDTHEDLLYDMPKMLDETNQLLMQETIGYCYRKLRTNIQDIDEISTWITNMRKELKLQILRKQRAELINKEIYSYMHDVFGPEMVDVFDLKYEPDQEETKAEEKV